MQDLPVLTLDLRHTCDLQNKDLVAPLNYNSTTVVKYACEAAASGSDFLTLISHLTDFRPCIFWAPHFTCIQFAVAGLVVARRTYHLRDVAQMCMYVCVCFHNSWQP